MHRQRKGIALLIFSTHAFEEPKSGNLKIADKISVSQGSAAKQLRCGGTFHSHLIANFPQSASVKEFLKSIWTKVWWHII